MWENEGDEEIEREREREREREIEREREREHVEELISFTHNGIKYIQPIY